MMHTRLMGGWWGHGEPIHVSSIAQNTDRAGGPVRDVRFERIHAEGEHGVVVYGEDRGAVQDIPGVHCENVKNLSLCDFRLAWAPDLPDFFTHGVACVHSDGVRIEGFEGSAARESDDLELIHLQGCDRVAIADAMQRVPSDLS
jgi:hypothetical protein